MRTAEETVSWLIFLQREDFSTTFTDSPSCSILLKASLLRTFARKPSTIQIFFILWLQSYNELPMSEMEKNWGVTDFVFEIKRVKNYPNFDKSALVTRHGLSAY